jgi:hypothetical protein
VPDRKKIRNYKDSDGILNDAIARVRIITADTLDTCLTEKHMFSKKTAAKKAGSAKKVPAKTKAATPAKKAPAAKKLASKKKK